MLGESCRGCGSLLEIGLGKCSGKGLAEGAEGRLKGCGGYSSNNFIILSFVSPSIS